jgi:hypothetical protein
MKRYYDFSLDELYGLSLYQWTSYMDEIIGVEKMLSGSGGKEKTDKTTTEDLMKMAEKKGIKTPKNY